MPVIRPRGEKADMLGPDGNAGVSTVRRFYPKRQIPHLCMIAIEYCRENVLHANKFCNKLCGRMLEDRRNFPHLFDASGADDGDFLGQKWASGKSWVTIKTEIPVSR